MKFAVNALGVVGLVLVSSAPPARGDRTDSVAGTVAIAAAATIACWTTAIATREEGAPEDGFARQGFYLGAAGAYAFDKFENKEQTSKRTVSGANLKLLLENVDESFGFKGSAGYRCHRYFAGEAEVEWLDGFDGNVVLPIIEDLEELGGETIGQVKIEPVVVTANLKGYLPFGRFQPYLLAGAGLMTARTKARDTGDPRRYVSDRDTEIALRLGGGIDVYATKHVVITLGADYVLPFDDLNNLDYISVGWGFQYRF